MLMIYFFSCFYQCIFINFVHNMLTVIFDKNKNLVFISAKQIKVFKNSSI